MTEKEKLLQTVIEAGADRKAENIVALDMEGLTSIADYFVICHGSNERQVQAIARSIKNAAEEAGHRVERMEGFDQARWILIDLGSVVCHVFHVEERSYYQLDKLWGDAPIVEVDGIDGHE